MIRKRNEPNMIADFQFAGIRHSEVGPRKKFKNDPKLVAAARELRDRYTGQINAAGGLLLPASACGKYDVSRQLGFTTESTENTEALMMHRLLEAA